MTRSIEYLKIALQTRSKDDEQKMDAIIRFSKAQALVKMETAFSEGIQLSTLKKVDESQTIYGVAYLIQNLCESMNIAGQNNMTLTQAAEAAILIIGKYWYLKLEEFILVLRMGRTGDFGTIYNRIDVQVICTWIEKFLGDEKRIAYIEKINTAYKTQETTNPLPLEFAQKVYEQMIPREEKYINAEKIDSSTFEQWVEEFRKQLPGYTKTELLHWHKQLMDKGLPEHAKMVQQILEDYRTGKRVYPHES